MGALSILLAFVRGSLAPLMQNALWCPLVCLLPLGIVGVTSLSYIPVIVLKISIMSSLRHLNNNIGRPIVFRCSEYSRCFRLGTCFWLSFVPFLIQLYPSSYLAPKLLLMFRWVVLLFKKLKKHILVKIIKSSSDDGHHSIGFILVYMWSLKLKLSSTWIPISSQVVASSLTWFPNPSSEFLPCWKLAGFRPAYILITVLCTYPDGIWEARAMTVYIHISKFSCHRALFLDVSVLAYSFVPSANITAVELFWI